MCRVCQILWTDLTQISHLIFYYYIKYAILENKNVVFIIALFRLDTVECILRIKYGSQFIGAR